MSDRRSFRRTRWPLATVTTANDPVDLRSDTMSRPSPEMMRSAMLADGGDDCYGENKAVKALEEHCAQLFGKEAALLMPSGTMSNQVAVKVLVDRGQEVICDSSYHLNFFEASPTTELGGVAVNAVDTADGILTLQAISDAIERRARWTADYAVPKLIWLENTINGRGGKVFPLGQMRQVSKWADGRGLDVYLDGARVLNASVASNVSPDAYGRTTTALAICFAKGLGCPMGSVLVGSKDFIGAARRFRKWYGGALHQSGFIAAAALYALENNFPRLAEDHENARCFASGIAAGGLVDVEEPDTNIVMFDIARLKCTSEQFVQLAADVGVRLLLWRGSEMRAVFSLNISHSEAQTATDAVAQLIERVGPAARAAHLPSTRRPLTAAAT